MAQQQAIHKFVLGNKEVEGKNAEFQYDHGWYSIVLINGEEREIFYKSRNAQEAYMKWNVYIGRKKERPVRDYGQNDAEPRDNRNYRDRRRGSSQEEGRGRRNAVQEEGRGRRNAVQEEGRGRRNAVQEEGRGYRNAVSEEERNRRNGAAEENRSRRNSQQGNNRGRLRSTARDAEERMNSGRIQESGSGRVQESGSGRVPENGSRRNSTKRAEASPSYTEKEENRRPNNSSDAHRNFEKRKAKARKDWSRRRKAEEGEKE